MTYSTYPAVDENYEFPPLVRQAIVDGIEMGNTYSKPAQVATAINDALATRSKVVAGNITEGEPGMALRELPGDIQALDLVFPPAGLGGANQEFGYLVANFGNNDPAYEKLSIHYSPDGKYVNAGINNPVHAPASGVRDPSIIKHLGVWYVVYTINNGYDRTLGISSSTDLINWATQTVISVTGATAIVQAWAPELVVDLDGTVRMFFTNVTSSSTLETWYINATNAALTTWSAPVKVTWATNPGNVIDPAFIYDGGSWTIFYGVEGYIHRATAATLTGTWTQNNYGDWAFWTANAPDANTHFEAPEIVKVGPDQYRIYLDRYVGTNPAAYTFAGYCYSEAEDLTGPWSAPKSCTKSPGYPGGQALRHGSWVKLTNLADQQLVKAVTVEGMPPVRHAEVSSGVNVNGGNLWGGTFTLDATPSRRAGDFLSIPAPRQVKILVEGNYSVDLMVDSTIPLNGGWVSIKGPNQIPNYASNDILPGGASAWSISASNLYLLAGSILEFHFVPGATQNSTQCSIRVRVTKDP